MQNNYLLARWQKRSTLYLVCRRFSSWHVKCAWASTQHTQINRKMELAINSRHLIVE